ncbi:hypothetical protein COLO4_08301 [Corchorus olitorius]|uniref:Uncharacterized protein n=1 Tax=Corchorus olitorius TaxID=93759 RepID=A0A1R3KGL5_9ROSI|nr:hypothetical protein COLO4_08301 [Corchorus olitorius]
MGCIFKTSRGQATDNQGNAIHVQTNEVDAEIFRDLVVKGALYLIAAFRLSRSTVSHVAVQANLIVWLTRRSVLRPVPDDLSPDPRHYFELYAEENFSQMANNNAFLAVSSFATKLYVNLEIDETAMVQAI